MAYLVRLTDRALRDLEYIYEQIHAEAVKTAYTWFNGLTDAAYSLEAYPDRGSHTPENRKLRQLLYGKKPHVYRIIYQVDHRNKAINVLHIRHGAMKPFRSEEITEASKKALFPYI